VQRSRTRHSALQVPVDRGLRGVERRPAAVGGLVRPTSAAYPSGEAHRLRRFAAFSAPLAAWGGPYRMCATATPSHRSAPRSQVRTRDHRWGNRVMWGARRRPQAVGAIEASPRLSADGNEQALRVGVVLSAVEGGGDGRSVLRDGRLETGVVPGVGVRRPPQPSAQVVRASRPWHPADGGAHRHASKQSPGGSASRSHMSRARLIERFGQAPLSVGVGQFFVAVAHAASGKPE
jgi:hypothetical protein